MSTPASAQINDAWAPPPFPHAPIGTTLVPDRHQHNLTSLFSCPRSRPLKRVLNLSTSTYVIRQESLYVLQLETVGKLEKSLISF
ncbi:hypothetical protein EVAR_94215_1 [Eumeta japonica]|uniref:Uncharacterized protein n=1 Tax=Eumeta variegata TaxID=151549 RepID=A0A4C1UMZ6_EUMVA|nr:hypothetical protein EVAR_94215_1 [Eumeta japonica]